MEKWLLCTQCRSLAIFIAVALGFATILYSLAASKSSQQRQVAIYSKENDLIKKKSLVDSEVPDTSNFSALQKHISFWDRNNDHIIWPHHVYTGFREIGFSIPFAITSLLIPVSFSYPTRLGHSLIPDPFLRIYLDSIHKAKHGSDTGIYDTKGNLRPAMFEEMFAEFDSRGLGSLGVRDLWDMVGRNRVAADPAGWTFAVMEWVTTWLLLQRDGRVGKEVLRECYDGSLFWRLREERLKGVASDLGYGWKEFFHDPLYVLRELRGS